jgi:hypothetical protein
VAGAFLPWRDVLHEGPVRAGLPLEKLSRSRAVFIADAGWGRLQDVLAQFEARDAQFRRAGRHDEIVLWFEHDLHDQLQLIQVLDGLAELRGPPVSLVCEAEYLGTMAPARAVELFALRSPVTRRHLQEAQEAWAAFRSSDPAGIDPRKPQVLRFLGAALTRHLQEFPWTTDGLSLLERRVLRALEAGPLEFAALVRAVAEEPAFLGDAVLAWHLERMRRERLLERRGEGWALSGKSRSPRVPRWLGGYEVRNLQVRWDPALGRLVS